MSLPFQCFVGISGPSVTAWAHSWSDIFGRSESCLKSFSGQLHCFEGLFGKGGGGKGGESGGGGGAIGQRMSMTFIVGGRGLGGGGDGLGG
jgi:hypothetical protein